MMALRFEGRRDDAATGAGEFVDWGVVLAAGCAGTSAN
jgi:hypothetical protein